MAAESLTFVEEIVLLALDDATGAKHTMPVLTFRYALAGALLAELAFQNRIDTDPQQLVVLSRDPTGNPGLDEALATIAASPQIRSAAHWLYEFSGQHERLEQAALDRLVARGILRRDQTKVLWVFGLRRYSETRQEERLEVRTRLAALLLGEELPDPHDAVLCSLLLACNLAPVIFPGAEFRVRSNRLVLLAGMDLVGREVGASIDTVTRAVHTALPASF